MKSILAGFLLCLAALAPVQLWSQDMPVSVDLRLVNSSVDVFYFGDLDFSRWGSAPPIFYLTISNRGEPVYAVLNFEVRIDGNTILQTRSNRFFLPTIVGGITFSNIQLNTGAAIIPGTGTPVEFGTYQVDLDQVGDLQKKVSSTGKLPSGRYEFFIEAQLQNENGSPAGTVEDPQLSDNILSVSNPTIVVPAFPGNRVGDGDPPEIGTTFPYFQWYSDADRFNLMVYEKMVSDISTDDVLSHPPMLKISGYPNKVFQYPTDSSPLIFFNTDGKETGGSEGPVRLLSEGKTYYWFVQADISTTSGDFTINSDIYQFRVISSESGAMAGDQILTYLRQILGAKYNDYMQLLNGYSPTGKIQLNNAPVGVDVLLDLASRIKKDKVKIQGVQVE